jgi:dihydroorotase
MPNEPEFRRETDLRPRVLINARLMDPASGRDEPGGLLVENGIIADLGPHLRRNAPEGVAVMDCAGAIVAPGLIDMRVFTGEPGREHRETLATASRAAAVGGVTTIIVMPNTEPVIDDVALVDFIERRARDTALVNVHPMAAMTRGLAGEEMTEIGLLKAAGAVAFTEGKKSLASARAMRNVMTYARDFGALIVHHTEEESLSAEGAMNSGEVATRLGLRGVPPVAELIMLDRDLRLVETTGAQYHAAQISTRASLERVREAKRRGLPISAGVSINHLCLNELDVGPYRTFFKMKPPLRGEDDRRAMVEGVADGSIDVIVSAHDPQDADVKRRPFAEAADGAIGLETMLGAALRLHHSGDAPLIALLRAMSTRPAEILGLPGGRLEKGAPADLTAIDIGAPWVVDPARLRSKSKNTPFDEAKLMGRAVMTMVGGRIAFQAKQRDRAERSLA